PLQSAFSMVPLPPRCTLFPYTTLFRSAVGGPAHAHFAGAVGGEVGIEPAVLGFQASDLIGLAGGGRGGQFRVQHAPVAGEPAAADRKSTRLNSSHVSTSYAVFCLKKKS